MIITLNIHWILIVSWFIIGFLLNCAICYISYNCLTYGKVAISILVSFMGIGLIIPFIYYIQKEYTWEFWNKKIF